MSVLDRFVRIRRLRAQAAENYALAAESFGDSVRARFLSIADHYAALADAELLSDQRERKFRLAEMQAARAAALAQKRRERARHAQPPFKFRLIKGDGAAARRPRVIVPARSLPSLAGVAAKRER